MPVEMLEMPMSVRVKFILKHKQSDEHEIRLERMKPVRGKLPPSVVEAGKHCWESYEAREKAWADYRGHPEDVCRVYGQARTVWVAARNGFADAVEANLEEIKRLHDEECECCPYDWDENTLFPVEQEQEVGASV
jgi:hypothetical protein